MKVRYVHHRAREVAPVGGRSFRVEPGQEVEVDETVGRSLLEQPALWQPVRAPAKPAAKTSGKDASAGKAAGEDGEI